MQKKSWISVVMIATLCMNAAVGAAAPKMVSSSIVEAPSEVSQWRGWIEQSRFERLCADQSERQCLVLGPLSLTESAPNFWVASFEYENFATKRVKLYLPGDDSKWPSEATISGQMVPIGRDSMGPYVMVEPQSNAKVLARIEMSRASTLILTIPPAFSIASIKPEKGELRWIDPGQGVDLSNKNVQEVKATAGGQEMNIRVARLIEDGQVPVMTTRIKVENGGERRAVVMEGILPEGSLPIQMQAPGAKLEGATLSFEAQIGTSILTITSRLNPSLDIKWIKPVVKGAVMDPREFVFVKSNENFRKVRTDGRAIDPKAIDPMLNFGDLPAYEISNTVPIKLAPKALEKLSEESKAQSMTEAWLDFSGQEVFALQNIHFEKSQQGWYEPVQGWKATQATVGESPAIVAKSDSGEQGKIATYKGMRELAVGVHKDVGALLEIPAIFTEGVMATQAKMTLHIPLGWRTLAVYGSGQSSAGWLASLSLWDWFLIILSVWACKSLLGWRAGTALLITMTLGRLFLGAPFGLFLPLLGCLALIKYLPPGGFRIASLVSFALIMVTLLGESTPFTMSRIQKTLHGVLEDHAQPGSGYSMNEPTPERSGGAEEGFGEARSPVFVANAPRGRPMSAGALPGGVNEQQSDSELKQKMAEPSAPAPAPVPLPPAMGSMPNDVLGSVVQDVSKGVSRLGNTPKRDSMAWEQGQGQVSVAGAQAGKGVPVWSSGIAVNVNFSSPSNTASVAKILLMPPWGVKLSGVLTLLSLWYLISVTALAAWAAYKNKLKKETSVTSNVDRDWVSGEQV